MAKLMQKTIDSLLKGTSRSFYLTLKALPSKVRSQIGLGYLLARISDTITDSIKGSTNQRLEALEQYNDRIQKRSNTLPNLSNLAQLQHNPAEAELLEKAATPVAYLEEFSNTDQQYIRRVLDIIISGQTLDLQRFAYANTNTIISLNKEDELDDYTYRVAGCVGEFWTHVSLNHLFEVDAAKEAQLFENAVLFGKGLQLINILRDLPEDLRAGRCYIPATVLSEHNLKPNDLLEQENMGRFQPIYTSYLKKTVNYFNAAATYINMLPFGQFRMRGACTLPVILGLKTVTLLQQKNILKNESRIKVSRPEVKLMMRQTALALTSRKRTQKLISLYRDA
ncbi:MAG: phytoene/squalene synthase family protein [Verrucomicrobiota bacterium]|nr:phytoene/squalene synthase family protein [Verrucomicrobiota bacterium]